MEEVTFTPEEARLLRIHVQNSGYDMGHMTDAEIKLSGEIWKKLEPFETDIPAPRARIVTKTVDPGSRFPLHSATYQGPTRCAVCRTLTFGEQCGDWRPCEQSVLCEVCLHLDVCHKSLNPKESEQ